MILGFFKRITDRIARAIPDIFKQKMFWAALVSLVYLVVKFYKPDIPFTQDELLAIVLFLLSLLGLEVEKALRFIGFLGK